MLKAAYGAGDILLLFRANSVPAPPGREKQYGQTLAIGGHCLDSAVLIYHGPVGNQHEVEWHWEMVNSNA